MPSLKTLLQDKMAQLFCDEYTIDEVRDVSPHFRRFRLSGDKLRTTSSVSAGDKLQIMIAGAGARTYTPFAHDVTNGSVDLLAYVHGDAPAARWVRSASAGASLLAFGPRGSLPLGTLNGPVVFFGDETSFSAAASLRAAHGRDEDLSFVFECTDAAEAQLALTELGLSARALVPRQPGAAHLAELDAQLRAALASAPRAHLVLTGHAQSIQGLRAKLKQAPVDYAGQKVKAYWADGKTGLD